MKYGIHINANTSRDEAVDRLVAMAADTCRLPMYWGNNWGRRFSNSDVRRFITKDGRGSELREVIINGPEDADPGHTVWGLEQVVHLCDWWPRQLFIYEIANELDWRNNALTPDAPEKHRRVMECMKQLRSRGDLQRGNLLLAVNMPSDHAPDWWWYDYVRDHVWDGYGCLIKDNIYGSPAPYAPDLLTVHIYGHTTGCDMAWHPLDWLVGWVNDQPNNTHNVKITEMGVNWRPWWEGYLDDERGRRYLEGVEIARRRGVKLLYGVDSVCFYGTSPAEGEYGFTAGDASGVGSRNPTHYCT
jgi:hypothetical protein